MSLAAATTLRRGRRLAVASLVAAAAFSLTACQNGDDKASAAPSATNSQAANGRSTAGDAKSGGSGPGGSSSGGSAAGKGTSHPSTTGGQSSAPGGSGGQGGASAGRRGVSGTWTGKLKWLTEDKLTVAPDSGAEQAFHLLDSTKALGAAALCEAPDGRVHTDASGYGTTHCTLDDARKAARMGTVDVRVTVTNGAATKIAERYHP
ncbi:MULTISPECIES: hypothetical protein [unclassified Streptomyces]|uniref:hypothetical protein n=1 Tax=unclassified Streptomyces TaxID=2593676 RepID=UPI0008864FA2|nr:MULTISPECIES: hypothetical protein [unclassified Streptomyces]PBC82986.1 hypothetical protein BX261_2906 [Streptomyces sp. 2321.6]SDR45849.1 hypothetical protein SAMN05216511_4296 [Streptomyces sp. KS_16]SEC79537.1 hypothetical protein SAMN05428940_2909 [Streptomyces sp. 2133.1]SEE88754.1 hypothetical protein SAMN05428954_4349 [Streptomyces sp. 2112.3]SNC69063.1 hypothetical protein SAMN06272741_2903 [Streptomyces sp. 2114.4]